ncbi:MAG: FHIPEP family type III secretion protein [Acetatifactor sp.]|nr:FHIPEP family type III secretion protein [Acetatifactor sp.]
MLTEFAERFIQLRQDQGYTQQKIAEKLGITPQAVSKWENGTSLPDAEMIRSIAQLMDCSTDYLLNHQVSAISQHNLESLQRQRQAEVENVIQKYVLVLEVGRGLVDMLVKENTNTYLPIHNMRMRLGDHMGIMIPMIQLRDNVTLGEKEYRILLHGREVVAQSSSEYPKYFYVRGEVLPVAEWRTVWPDGEWLEKQDETPAGYVEFSAFDCIVAHLSEVILQNYDRILNRQLTADMVNMVRRRYPAAVDGVVPERVPLSLLQHVLAGLVTSRTPINQLDYIIGYLEEHPVSGPEGIEAAVAALSRELH